MSYETAMELLSGDPFKSVNSVDMLAETDVRQIYGHDDLAHLVRGDVFKLSTGFEMFDLVAHNRSMVCMHEFVAPMNGNSQFLGIIRVPTLYLGCQDGVVHVNLDVSDFWAMSDSVVVNPRKVHLYENFPVPKTEAYDHYFDTLCLAGLKFR